MSFLAHGSRLLRCMNEAMEARSSVWPTHAHLHTAPSTDARTDQKVPRKQWRAASAAVTRFHGSQSMVGPAHRRTRRSSLNEGPFTNEVWTAPDWTEQNLIAGDTVTEQNLTAGDMVG